MTVFQVEFFWFVTPCSVVVRYQSFRDSRYEEGSLDFWKVGNLPQHYTASQTRTLLPESSPPWKPHNLYHNRYV